MFWRFKYAVHLTPGLPEGAVPAPTRAATLALRSDIGKWLNETIDVSSSGQRCQNSIDSLIGPDAKDDLQVLMLWTCPQPADAGLSVVFRAFETRLEDWQNIVSIRLAGNTYNTVFTPRSTRLLLGSAADDAGSAADAQGGSSVALARPDGVATYFALGARQMATVPDHALFLVGLLLGSAGLARMLTLAAAFTVAHSLGLTLAALGLLALPSAPILLIVALSVVCVAAEGLLRVGDSGRVVTGAAFGLVHGFAFAAALSAGGLAGTDVAAAMLAYNGGIEAAQLVLLAALVPLLLRLGSDDASWPRRRALGVLLGLAGLISAALRGLALLR